jgi:hypothetical protein
MFHTQQATVGCLSEMEESTPPVFSHFSLLEKECMPRGLRPFMNGEQYKYAYFF